MPSSFDDTGFLAALAKALRDLRLSAIVVGNVASILHDVPVMTTDVDLLVRDTMTNRRKKTEQLAAMLDGTTQPIMEQPGERGWPGRYDGVRIHNPIVPVDVLFRIAGVTFDAVRARASRKEVGGQRLTVASLADVIKSKEAAGREKDVASLPILRSTLAAQRALKRRRGKRPAVR
jgi:hypothetical protein